LAQKALDIPEEPSMDETKCEIVSDMAWWIDVWIKRFYKRTERFFVWHDVTAQEVSEDKFYKYRYGGGTTCSSALKLIAKQFENRFPPKKWNIYVFYFTDGENQYNDNPEFINVLKEKFGTNTVNLFGVTQINAYDYRNSVMEAVDTAIVDNVLEDNVKTTDINANNLNPEDRSKTILEAIRQLMGAKGSSKLGSE